MRRITGIIHPFEILYLAIAIATFQHTAWTASYLFEGPQAEGRTTWIVQGALIAIAVDVGMLMTSRFLVGARGRQKVVLVSAFVIAAITSFFFQLVYMAIHTPTVTVSAGVNASWSAFLNNVIEARVLIIPLALPVLATVYTMARLTSHPAPKEIPPEARSNGVGESVALVQYKQRDEGRFIVDGLSFRDTETGKLHGPYKSMPALKRAIKNVEIKS